MNTKRSLKRAVPSAIIAVLATGFILSPQAMAQSSSSSDLGSLSSNGSASKHQTDKTKTGQDSQTSVSSKSILKQNETLRVGQSLRSENGKFEAQMQEDGNLVIQGENKTVTWSTNVKKTGDFKELVMQQDGNLVLYIDHQAVWASHTETSNANCLTLTNEGALQVKKDDSVVWDSSKSGDKADNKTDTKKDDKAPSQDAKKDDKAKDAQKTDAPKKDDKPKADAPKDDNRRLTPRKMISQSPRLIPQKVSSRNSPTRPWASQFVTMVPASALHYSTTTTSKFLVMDSSRWEPPKIYMQLLPMQIGRSCQPAPRPVKET